MAKVTKRRGRYVLDFYDQNGKRQRQTMPEGSSLKKAKDKLREIEDQLAKGLYVHDKKIPTFAEVAKEWIGHKKTSIRDSTWEVYEGHTKHHFPELKDHKMNRITIAMLEKWTTERQKSGMPIGTIRKILVSLGQIFRYAARHQYISYNPFLDAERPKAKSQKDKIRILSPDEINTLLDAVDDQKYQTLFTLAVMSGARQGELLGSKWSDIDWEKSQIHIQRTFNNARWYEPKTETSNRRIDLGPNMMKALKKWRIACPPNKLNLIFPNREGLPINHNNLINRNFFPTLKKADLPRIRFHDLRHTFASLLIEQGENIKYIQTQLGHSSPTVTLNVYAHLMKKVNQESACRLENTIFQATGHKMVTKKENMKIANDGKE